MVSYIQSSLLGQVSFYRNVVSWFIKGIILIQQCSLSAKLFSSWFGSSFICRLFILSASVLSVAFSFLLLLFNFWSLSASNFPCKFCKKNRNWIKFNTYTKKRQKLKFFICIKCNYTYKEFFLIIIHLPLQKLFKTFNRIPTLQIFFF